MPIGRPKFPTQVPQWLGRADQRDMVGAPVGATLRRRVYCCRRYEVTEGARTVADEWVLLVTDRRIVRENGK